MDAKLQEAVDGSIKDQVRKAESLNLVKRRVLKEAREAEKYTLKSRIERFQSPLDRPYHELAGAAVITSNNIYSPTVLQSTITAHHPNNQNLTLIVIRGEAMMDLIHELYTRAADEA